MIIFWDYKDVLFVDFLPCSTIVDGPYYASLFHRLCSSIREKRHGKLRHGVLFLHNNTPVHKSNTTHSAIQYTGSTELNHSVYSPDHSPRDYHLLSDLKNFLLGRYFEIIAEAIMIVNHYSESLDSDLFLGAQKVGAIDGLV